MITMNNIRNFNIQFFIIGFMIFTSSISLSHAQSEYMAWGNLIGIRVDGQLMEFESGLAVVSGNFEHVEKTAKERQKPKYMRKGNSQTVNTAINNFGFTKTVSDIGKGKVEIDIIAKADEKNESQSAFLFFELPTKYYTNGQIEYGKKKVINLINKNTKSQHFNTSNLEIKSENRSLKIESDSKHKMVLVNNNQSIALYIELLPQQSAEGTEVHKQFTLTVGGTIDDSPVSITIDSNKPGRQFLGMGGNFRLQNPTTDPQVIQYCLDSMRVAYGRVEMPWQLWHPDETANPLNQTTEQLHPHVKASMEMAQKLAARGMPVIVSAWSAPRWAIIGEPEDAFRYRDQGIFGYPLNNDKIDKIYQSITDYLLYLKKHFGVEAIMFSFNESDLGINVRHTAYEHRDFIKGLGAHMAKRQLATSMLLGDNSDATTFDFIVPALNDSEAHKYIGAVSFHSWRGCDDETLEKWGNAARQLNIPLVVGEGSTDAAAWNYPQIFSEFSFAFHEINLYTRICAIAQPQTILQWQLTADYSILTGGGVFGTEGPLRPTQRFWNLKQLAATPENSFVLPSESSSELINCVAFGNIAKGEYAIHIVNNGAKRKANIVGLPEEIESFNVYVTDCKNGMKKVEVVKSNKGNVEFDLMPAAFISLFGNQKSSNKNRQSMLN
jgi:hypothetical protein